MAKVSFFTPINFGNQPKSTTEWLLEKADGFFYLGGPKAHLIKTDQGTKAVLVNERQSLLMTCFKVASYFTILLPTIPFFTQVENPLTMTCLKVLSCFAFLVPIILIAKAVLRCTHSYEIDARSIKSRPHQPIDPSVIDTLELNLDEEATVDASEFDEMLAPYIPTKFTLRQAATEVIAKINEAILKKPIANPLASEQEKHSILLKTERPWMKNGSNLYFYAEYCGIPSNSGWFLNAEQTSKLWLNRIIQALEDRNHIQLIASNGHGYYIQA
jgi:hypothetical protein